MSVRFFGALNSNSGYGNAVRNFAEAFSKSSVNTFYHFDAKMIKCNQNFFDTLKHYNGTTKVDFYLHGPPWTKHISKNYKIAYFYWEADKLPFQWAKKINSVDEIWAPCDLVFRACKSAGFRGKIKIVPTPGRPFEIMQPYMLPADDKSVLRQDVFKFYSIFQWHYRKGFDVLLESYFREFSEKDNVVLILKVNPLNVGKYNDEGIKQDIAKIKMRYRGKKLPLVFLSKDIIERKLVDSLHYYSDCYVSPHRGEGWGMPIFDAMYAGKQIITTPFGGITEYLDNSSAHLIDYKIGPVKNMEWSPLYNARQNWAHPSIDHLSHLMRDAYTNKDLYIHKCNAAKILSQKFTIESISKSIDESLS